MSVNEKDRDRTPIPESSVAHYDVAVIGSSLVSLLEALQQRRLGKKVVVIEAADRIGGAWRECSVFGLRRVEIGPHYLTYNAATYAYLERDLKVRMIPMAPLPVYIVSTRWGNLWIPYYFTSVFQCMNVVRHFIKNKLSHQTMADVKEEYLDRLGNAARQSLQWLFSRNKPRLKYPLGGTLDLMDRLAEQLAHDHVDVKMSTRVCGISKGLDGVLTLDLRDSTLTAEQAFMTTYQNIDWISDGQDKYQVQCGSLQSVLLHILLYSEHRPRISCALVKRCPDLRLISDITPYTKGIPPKHYVIVVRLNQCKGLDCESAEKYFHDLKRKRIIAAGAVMKDFHFSKYEQGYISKALAAEIQERLGAAITFIWTINPSTCIGDNAARWTAGETRLRQGESSFSRPQ